MSDDIGPAVRRFWQGFVESAIRSVQMNKNKHYTGRLTFGRNKQMGAVEGKARVVDAPGWWIGPDRAVNSSCSLDIASVCHTASQSGTVQEANAARLVDCWNACVGIPDPADLRRRADVLREWLAIERDRVDRVLAEVEKKRAKKKP